MKLPKLLLHLNKKGQKTINQSTDQKQREALILTSRQQFKKLQELGLKLPIAVL
jgi:hypothetical protein